jgi:uncharacterized membrane protein YgcG
VVIIGIPFQYTLSKILRARLEYMKERFQIDEGDFLTFDAMRQASQCMGRVIRSKTDYGIMILADQRYGRADKRNKLPTWIRQYLHEDSVNLSTDMAVSKAKEFLAKMSVPQRQDEQVGSVLLSVDDIQGGSISYAPEKPGISIASTSAAEPASKRAKQSSNRAPQGRSSGAAGEQGDGGAAGGGGWGGGGGGAGGGDGAAGAL